MFDFELLLTPTEVTRCSLQFRRYRPEDADALFLAGRESAGPGFTDWMPWCHPGYALDEAVSYAESRPGAWERGEDYALVILDAATGDLVGGCGINQLSREHNFANLGYWVRRSRWGQGIAVAAVQAASTLAFELLDLGRVEIVVAVGNQASRRAAEKSGAHFEGILRNRLVLHGRRHDAWMFSHVPR